MALLPGSHRRLVSDRIDKITETRRSLNVHEEAEELGELALLIREWDDGSSDWGWLKKRQGWLNAEYSKRAQAEGVW